MTEELYYTSAYITEFFAKVISCDKVDNGYEIILDRTAFFPEQGGQGCDNGVLELVNDNMTNDSGALQSVKVQHVSIEQTHGDNGEIITTVRHLVDKEIPEGESVHGIIDWNHRFSNMQQHTGEHIFSGIVSKRFGYDNVGFHLSDSEVTMDYSGVLTLADIKDIELAVNRAIWENVKVIAEFPDKDKLDSIDYRSKKELTGDVRIVTVEGYDCCACCAPHVEHTGEIGLLKVVGLQNYKKGVRVSILCGERALLYLDNEHEILSKLSGRFTTSSDKVITSVNKLFEDNDSLKNRLVNANDKLMEYELLGIDKGLSNVFLVKEKDFDQVLMRKAVNNLAKEHAGYCGIFAGDDAGYRFIIASGTEKRDCKNALDALKASFDVKGGGSSAMIQGNIAASDISQVLNICNNL